ncbi:TetR/AcrR family transcriptional regulator [Aeromicrobium chenweiae]|uniref:TetR family transcriptional regulator n=1 Tax=Aeromicrobium chenweiae TaxID=2079793 RepID=A0A2S0WQ21_9ACTN|nr:TetR/AcrR family transcriptional regulator [Aeromicrobium chenweiae]AWB93453.1 TetR family transcriptional regulator [Aeromicrobium chenweiae]TGN34444.1 TetR/AcrR family transcriptional regulator [Aeromicrobium chenweiae]
MNHEKSEQLAPARPRRADARRNYDKLVEAAREAFAEGGADTSLEAVARRAGVGIATLYRNFPDRADLLEAVYLEEVEAFCDSAAELLDEPPWDALAEWLRRLTAYLLGKQALSPVLLSTLGHDAEVFQRSRAAFYAVGQPLLDRAQEAGVVRPDTDLAEILKLTGGIAKIPFESPAEIDHLLELALDGLRYRSPVPDA